MNNSRQFDIRLERYLLGELPAEEVKKLDAELKKNPALRRKLEDLKAETNAYFAKYPKLGAAKTKPATGSNFFSRLSGRFVSAIGGGLALAAAAVIIASLLPRHLVDLRTQGSLGYVDEGQGETGIISKSGIRTKGDGPSLSISALTDTAPEKLTEAARVKPGTRLMIEFTSGDLANVAVVSVDASRSTTLHWPAKPSATQKPMRGKTRIPGAFELDDTPGEETFYLIASNDKIDIAAVLRQLRKTGKPGIGSNSNTVIRKFSVLK